MDNYVAKGDSVTWNNGTGSDVSSGDVVELGNCIGIAKVDIADGDDGEVAIEGVYTVPKVSAAVFSIGDALIWDTSAGAFDDGDATAATGDITGAGVAMADGANGETEATVKLTPGNTTVT